MKYDDKEKIPPQLIAISQDIGILAREFMNVSMKFYKAKADLEMGSFNPIDWTAIILSSYLTALFAELDNMGAMIKTVENNDKFNQKVKKFERIVARASKEMSDISDCFQKRLVN